MKMVLLVGALAPHGIELQASLVSQGFTCTMTETVDEIDQVIKQLGRVVLIFNDYKFAYKFLVENKWDGFSNYNIYYSLKTPVVSKDAQSKLSQVDLNIFTTKTQAQLFENINEFYLNGKTHDLEIEFSVHEQLRRDE